MNSQEIIALERQWRDHTDAANTLFNSNRHAEAAEGYASALVSAETLNRHPVSALRAGLPIVQIFVLSCQNLSNALVELDRLAEADALMRRSVHFLIHSIEDKATAADVRDEAIREVGRALIAYAEFVERTGLGAPPDEMLRMVRMTRTALTIRGQAALVDLLP